MRCNLRCVHCYCGDQRRSDSGLNASAYEDIIDQITEAGCMWLLVTGGEPLLHPQFEEIYLYAKKSGLFLTLFTNATLVTAGMAEFLAEWRPFSIEVTLYGASRETYSVVTGNGDAYDRCISGIELLLEHGLEPKLKTMVLRENIHDLDRLHHLAESMGLSFRFDPILSPTISGSLDPTRHRLKPETVLELDRRYKDRIESWREFMEKFYGTPPQKTLYSCGAGINTFTIDSRGRLFICTLARGQYYDLLAGSFKQGWNGFIKELRQRRPSGPHRCGACSLLALCGCCPGWAALEADDEEGSVDFLCRVAAMRARAYGQPEVRRAGETLLELMDSTASVR